LPWLERCGKRALPTGFRRSFADAARIVIARLIEELGIGVHDVEAGFGRQERPLETSR
jgi:hypothetical protein